MTYPGECIKIDVKFVPASCIVSDKEEKHFQFTDIDEFTRLRYLASFRDASTFSTAQFVLQAIQWYRRRGIEIRCIQSDNGIAFTKRLIRNKEKYNPTLFELVLAQQNIEHQKIKPYTPHHNGKIKRGHREDQKRIYNNAKFLFI